MRARILLSTVTALFAAAAWAEPSPLVAPDHWAVRAAERLEQLGLVEGYLPAQRAVPLAELKRVLEAGADAAPPQLTAVTSAWVRRFDAEFYRHEGALPLDPTLSASVRVADRSTSAAQGPLPFDYVAGPAPHAPQPTIGAMGMLSLPYLAAFADVEITPERIALPQWEGVVELGPVSFSVGRRPVAYGFGQGTGVIYSGRTPFNRVEVQTSRPLDLGILGTASAHAFYATVAGNRHPASARMFAGTVFWKPVPRLTLSVNRATIYGSTEEELSAGAALAMIGLWKNSYENNLVSGALRYRLPSEALLPLTVYAEWGTEDSAGNHLYTPGLMAGLSAPSVPGVPWLSLGGEFAFFGMTTKRNLRWYTHSRQRGGWVLDDLPMGHPMGGNGREYRLYASAPIGERVHVDVAGFHRTRFSKNLYSPTREGLSLGGEAKVSWRPTQQAELTLAGAYEGAQSWSESSAQLGAAVWF